MQARGNGPNDQNRLNTKFNLIYQSNSLLLESSSAIKRSYYQLYFVNDAR